mmetsp:Transcript_11615/g.32056  ORF Transcript_11615/g.32056 Transcript_11615/m.32056 type:complete len:265 (-) Transcript_11615:398-1192(-)
MAPQTTSMMASEAQSMTEEKPLRFSRMPSITATRPKRYPQKHVAERQKKVAQDSIADAEIVPAPPKMRLTDVTTNSAKNSTPPELPTSCPTRKAKITTFTRFMDFKMDRVLLAPVDSRQVSMVCSDMLSPKLMLPEKTVRRLSRKCGVVDEKLPIVTSAPIASFLKFDASPVLMTRCPKDMNPRPFSALKDSDRDTASGSLRLRQYATCFLSSFWLRRFHCGVKVKRWRNSGHKASHCRWMACRMYDSILCTDLRCCCCCCCCC